MSNKNKMVTFFILLCAVSAFYFVPAATADQELETYLVHCSHNGMKAAFETVEGKESWYRSILSHVTDEESRMVHKYHNVLNGFAARLTREEAQKLQEKDEVVIALPQQTYALLTTHSSKFLGIQRNSGIWSGSNSGKSVIVAVLDGGITPNHPSFRDEGMPPPPAGPPIDEDGHGTHCASTAAGNFVDDAGVFNEANGTAAGMAPYAHLAIYKVCTNEKCNNTDILAAMDAAISDGVDVFSLSFGSAPLPLYSDAIALGTFAAMKHGIFVSAAAGNNGSLASSLSNESPWMLTVGASTIDREIRATASLGNNEQFDGESLFQPKDFSSTTEFPLVFFPNTTNYNQTAMFCAPGSLHNIDVKGKIVLCQRGDETPRIAKGKTVKDAGGAGMIIMNGARDGYSTLADLHVLPAAHISYKAGRKILAYVNSTSTPTATFLFKGTILGIENAPSIASFSSRGPTRVNVGILKPDIIGPGVSIIAAWPFSVDNNTNTLSTFNMISGTSMACPHLSGIAALIKSAHPNWSPYICGMGYNDTMVGIIINRPINCSTIKAISGQQLNYPSFSIDLQSNVNVTYTRTVTNVGEPSPVLLHSSPPLFSSSPL